jgi:hypothetical protein
MVAQLPVSVGLVHEAAWDRLLTRFSDRTVFHSLIWLQIVGAVHNLKLVLAKAEQGGSPLAIWPFLIARKGPLRVFGSPLPGWSTPYGGPLFANDVSRPQVIGAFLDHPAFQGFAYYACKMIDRDAAVDLRQCGFTRVLNYDTFQLNLEADEAALWDNCRRECRNHIRKAQKNGVEIRIEQSSAFIDDYWDMTVETFARDGSQPTHSKKFIEAMWQLGRPLGIVTFLSAFHEHKRIGTIVLLHDDQTMYYWGGAAHLRYRHLSASNLLQWQGICEAKRRGLQTYDFISTTGGPGKFKASFGPQRIDIATHWERSSSRLMQALKNQYERFLRKRQRASSPGPVPARAIAG